MHEDRFYENSYLIWCVSLMSYIYLRRNTYFELLPLKSLLASPQDYRHTACLGLLEWLSSTHHQRGYAGVADQYGEVGDKI